MAFTKKQRETKVKRIEKLLQEVNDPEKRGRKRELALSAYDRELLATADQEYLDNVAASYEKLARARGA